MDERLIPQILLILFIVFVLVIVTVIKLFSFCRIFSKAGYSWAFGLLMLLPMAEIVIPLVLALIDWPVRRELRQLRQRQGGLSQ